MSIILMSDELANKIAAGEVVERPASVVKELVENSIDAKSTSIKIDILEAGLQQIKVTDNGVGILESDIEKAFLRHATSKIKDIQDLFHVRTLGFRGEALASIASVSKLTIKSSTGDSASTLLHIAGGKVESKQKGDARKGTEITVSDLFYNTPARLKYMKTIHTELGHITDLLNRLALSHPEIRFDVTHNGKQLFRTSGNGDLLQVIAQIYGMEVAKKMVPIQQDTLDFLIRGYVGQPEVTRASRGYISIIINGRFIKSIPLSQAIIRAYHTLLPIGRYPIVVVTIQMDPILVDVNVHPAKLEARFSKEKELIALVEETIRQKFRDMTLIPEMKEKVSNENKSVQHSLNFDHIKETAPRVYEERPNINRNQAQITEQNKANVSQGMEQTAIIEKNIPLTNQNDKLEVQEVVPSSKKRVPVMYPIGQLHGTYILAQNETGLYMIDQHAAQERIKYEYFSQKLSETDNILQDLLMPLTFEFSQQEAIFIEQYKEEFKKVGLFFEDFGINTYVIRSYPNWFPPGFEEEVIREMITQIIEHEKIDIQTIRDDAAKLMSCKRSIKANHYLNKDDMYQLLEDLRYTTDPFTCPHGRPIIIHFSSYELEKMFKRVM